MAQVDNLAPAATVATGTDVVVAPGSSATIGMYVASGDLPSIGMLTIMQDTPGADVPVAILDKGNPSLTVGPGTFRVRRVPNTDWPTPIGSYSEA